MSGEKEVKKIIHVDMDCFYAAIEIRDQPELADKPVAVGGTQDKRGVLCTCNYIARQFGLHSAMSTATALRLCPDLVLMPTNMAKYKAVSARIQSIFKGFTDLVEPLSLDEAYLDVSNVEHYQGSATLIAKAIRQRIFESEQLTASAGVAPNKFLAKIASGWQKPNGLFVIRPQDVPAFVSKLQVKELFGVGKVTAQKMYESNIKTCADLQKWPLPALLQKFGKFGQQLYDQCRGIDRREIMPHRTRKSLSVERTFSEDIHQQEQCVAALKILYEKLLTRIDESAADMPVKNQFVKIKFNDFRLVTIECATITIDLDTFLALFLQSWLKDKNPIRLIGLGVHFDQKIENKLYQYPLF